MVSSVTQYLDDAALGVMTERFAPSGGGLYWRSYILADGRIAAERSVKGSTVTVRYFVLDHLGSTVALTDETGALAESDAYDAWGRQRNPTTGGDDTTCSLPSQSFSTRGFTGQEEMDDLCLVNLNARIYDPALGRFLSPDDVIPDLYNGQSYNRYTYVDDNPLSYEDPTGHCPSCSYSFITVSSGGNVSDQYCHGCQSDYDMTDSDDDDTAYHASSTGLADSGSTQTNSPSGIASSARTIAGAIQSASANDSPQTDDPLQASPQTQQAKDIDASQASGAGQFGGSSSAQSGCEDCVASNGHVDPRTATWTMRTPNEKWKSKISVVTVNGVEVISGSLTVSASQMYVAQQVADEVNEYWGNASGVYDGITYQSNITMTAVESGGDWQIDRYGIGEYMRANRSIVGTPGIDTVGGENQIGASHMLIPPSAFGAIHYQGDWAHEFGHALGLTHAPDGSGSIMSYDRFQPRAALGRDLFNLARGYQ